MDLDNSGDNDVELTSETDQGGIIIPKQACEHVQNVHLCENFDSMPDNQCVDCENSTESWLCLSCGESHCSRYVNNHGEEHWLFTLLMDAQDNLGHCLTISLQDLSVWCYPCNSYVKNIRLNSLIKQLEGIKFGSSTTEESENPTETPTTVNSISTIIAVQDPLLLNALEKTDLLSYCFTIKLRSASIDELTRLHSSDYVNMIASAEKTHGHIVAPRFHIQYDEKTFSNARFSAGTTIDAIGNILHNHHINGLILTTSPSHRAFPDHGNGTSIYNNLALAINSILTDRTKATNRKDSLALFDSNNHLHFDGASPIENAICHMIHVLAPISDDQITSQDTPMIDNDNPQLHLERVLIVDLTSEHGSGLQSIYYESDQVFYVSIHQEDHQHRSSYHDCGKSQGLGHTMNIPLASADQINDQDYTQIISELILPIAKEYQPELILVCVDFHHPNLTTSCYAWIIEQLNKLTDGKLVVTLDGNLSDISTKISYVQTLLSILIGKLSVINNDEWKNPSNNTDADVRRKIDLIKENHKQYWSCFR